MADRANGCVVLAGLLVFAAAPAAFAEIGVRGDALRDPEGSPVLVALRERGVHDARVHQLVPTGELSGEWGAFEVIEFNKDYYVPARTPGTEPTGNEWTGWLRLVNSEGTPMFWFFTRD